MEELCEKLHPSIYIEQTCLQWFTEAIDHCSDLIMYSSASIGGQFWRKLKNFVMPTGTASVWQKTPVFLHPQHLSPMDCQSLFLDIAKDYIKRAPANTPKPLSAEMFGSVLIFFSTIVLLAICILKMQRYYKNWWGESTQRKSSNRSLVAERQLEAQMLWVTNRSVRIMKTELNQLRLRHLVQAEDLIPSDGSATLVLKMQSKLQLFNNIIHGGLQGSGCLYLPPEQRNKDTTGINELKTIKVTRAVNLLNNYSHQLRLLIVFDEDASYEDVLLNKAKSFTLPPEKSVVAPSQEKSDERPVVKSLHSVTSPQNSTTSLFRRTSTTTFPSKSIQSTILRGATTLQLTAAQHSSILRRRKNSSQSTTPRETTTSEQQSPLGYSSSLCYANLATPRRISPANQLSITSCSRMLPQTKTSLESIISPRSKITPQTKASMISYKTTPPQPRTSLPSRWITPPQTRSPIQSKTITWSETTSTSRTPMPVNLSPRSMKDPLQATITHKPATTIRRQKTAIKALPESQIPLTSQNKSTRNRSDRSDQLSKNQSDAQESQLKNPSNAIRNSALPRPSFTSLTTCLLKARDSKTSISK